MRDLGPATRLDNTRPCSLSGRASRASQPMGTARSKAEPKATSLGRYPGAASRKGSVSMIWKSQGGGPWGSGPRGGGPWGGGPRNNGTGGQGPRGRNPYQPDFEEWLRRGQERVRRIVPGGFGTGTGIAVVLIAILVIWLASGFYRVLPDEVGIVLRFGAYNRTTQPGLNYHLPAPIETALTPSVTRVNRTEIGYRSADSASGRGVVTRQVPEEALMLTGDENIVDINFAVFWVIKDAKAYLFNIRDPEMTVKSAAESAMREVIGETPIAS